MHDDLFEEGGALLNKLFQFGRCTHDHIQRKTAVWEQIRHGAVAFKDTAGFECIGHNQQIHIAVGGGLAVSTRAKQDYLLRIERSHNLLDDLA